MCNSSRDTDKFFYREYMPSAWQVLSRFRFLVVHALSEVGNS